MENNVSPEASQKMTARWQAWAPKFLSVLRIMAGLLFYFVGTMKLLNFPIAMPAAMGPVKLLSLIGIAGLLEVVGGLLITLGLFTRPTAFILSGEMAVAYFIGHAGNGFWPIANGGTDAILYCFLFLYLSSVGAGAWSIDAWREKREVASTNS